MKNTERDRTLFTVDAADNFHPMFSTEVNQKSESETAYLQMMPELSFIFTGVKWFAFELNKYFTTHSDVQYIDTDFLLSEIDWNLLFVLNGQAFSP